MSKKSKTSQAPQDVSSNSIDIKDMPQFMKENMLKTDLLRAEEKCAALSLTVDSLLKKLEDKEEEIIHLKQMLFSTTPVVGEVTPLILSDEEMIAELQLQKIKDNAKLRELTLDEIKKFDLLVKNKRLSQGNATTINTDKLPKDAPKAQLMEIASRKTRGEQ